jgi:hypothetical protein
MTPSRRQLRPLSSLKSKNKGPRTALVSVKPGTKGYWQLIFSGVIEGARSERP